MGRGSSFAECKRHAIASDIRDSRIQNIGRSSVAADGIVFAECNRCANHL